MDKPSFIIIGAAKSATTSLYSYFSEHPQVTMSSIKEARYFCYSERPDYVGYGPRGAELVKKYVETLPTDWSEYQSYFDDSPEIEHYGEASPAYLCVPGTAARIKEKLSKVKLIAVLRNPIARAYSSYLHMCREDAESLDFMSGLMAEKERIEEGCGLPWRYCELGHYVEQLREYRDQFSEGDLEVVIYDDLCREPLTVMSRLYEFVGIDSCFQPSVEHRANVSVVSRNKGLVGAVQKTLSPILPRDLRRKFRRISARKQADAPPMPEDARAFLTKEFENEIILLSEFLERDLSPWLKGEKVVL